eukprot:4516077-Alexandrium_andersonii.AAC.1
MHAQFGHPHVQFSPIARARQALAAHAERDPDDGHGDHRNDPATTMAKPSLLDAFARGSPWPSSGQRGSACA